MPWHTCLPLNWQPSAHIHTHGGLHSYSWKRNREKEKKRRTHICRELSVKWNELWMTRRRISQKMDAINLWRSKKSGGNICGNKQTGKQKLLKNGVSHGKISTAKKK